MGNEITTKSGDPFLPDVSFDDEEMLTFRLNIWQLLGYQTERWTMGDSSSVPVEVAEELLRSICFTLHCATESGIVSAKELARPHDLRGLLKRGQAEIKDLIKKGKKLLGDVVRTTPQIENISYRDTLSGLAGFFKKYDWRYFAHEIPASIDYQLCRPVPDNLYGIKYINEYLGRLSIENRVIGSFDVDIVISLLKCHCPDYRGLLINLYEPVAANAMGLALLDEDIFSLDVGADRQRRLVDLFKKCSKEEAIGRLKNAAGKVALRLGFEDAAFIEYLRQTSVDLYPRINAAAAAGWLGGVFIALPYEIGGWK